jgi:DNA-binding IclR family transcriptional regulator
VSEREPLPEHYRVKALEQALAILDLLADEPEFALPEIARRVGLQTPNAHKLILHLQDAGLVETGPVSKRYRLGASRLGELTARALTGASPWEALRGSVPALQMTGMPG